VYKGLLFKARKKFYEYQKKILGKALRFSPLSNFPLEMRAVFISVSIPKKRAIALLSTGQKPQHSGENIYFLRHSKERVALL